MFRTSQHITDNSKLRAIYQGEIKYSEPGPPHLFHPPNKIEILQTSRCFHRQIPYSTFPHFELEVVIPFCLGSAKAGEQ